MPSSDFTVDGATCPPEASTTYGATVNLAALSNAFNASEWRIVGTDRPGTAAPVITPGGSPIGVTATFVVGADPGDGLGISYLVERVVNGGVDASGIPDATLTKRALVGVGNTNGIIPFSVGEKGERSTTHGWCETINQILASAGGGGGGLSVGGTPAVDKFVGYSGSSAIWLTIKVDGATLQNTSGTWSVKAGGISNSHIASNANIALSKLGQSGATTGQYASWNGTAWAPVNAPAGATGATGPTGATGASGGTGATGATGANGTDGTNGTNGTNGSNGVDAFNAIPGTTLTGGTQTINPGITGVKFTLPAAAQVANAVLTITPGTGLVVGDVVFIEVFDVSAYTYTMTNGGPAGGVMRTKPGSPGGKRIYSYQYDGADIFPCNSVLVV